MLELVPMYYVILMIITSLYRNLRLILIQGLQCLFRAIVLTIFIHSLCSIKTYVSFLIPHLLHILLYTVFIILSMVHWLIQILRFPLSICCTCILNNLLLRRGLVLLVRSNNWFINYHWGIKFSLTGFSLLSKDWFIGWRLSREWSLLWWSDVADILQIGEH
jgi:hypothetical protein